MAKRPEGNLFQPSTAEASRRASISQSFDKLWSQLFTSPIHLDSALSKLSPRLKSILAQTVPVILLRPVSTAEAVGVGVPPGEPWALDAAGKGRWRAAAKVMERLWEKSSSGGVPASPVREDFPPALLEEWEGDWGAATTDALVAALATEPPLTLRAARKLGAAGLLESLTSGSKLPVKATLSQYAPTAVRLSGYVPVMGLERYERGEFEIQDEGSQVMAHFALWPEAFAPLLQSAPGPCVQRTSSPETQGKLGALQVVDACAGAGGKSLALADLLQGKGRVYSYDVSEKKLAALRRRAKRAHVTNIQTVQVQEELESATVSRFAGSADIVLVDAPCSGWGVLRRNPDIKWRQAAGALERLPALQLRLLREYSALVRPGGRLVYGLCTFRKAETLGVVERFLSEQPGFQAGPGGFFGPGPSDGFFMQSFIRHA
jgi:16S rRNA C967 or C1407 C5-methylase (RsmB/RsmF family)